MIHLPITLLLSLFASLFHTATSDEYNLLKLIDRLNSDVLELRNQVEFHYQNRCDTIFGCTSGSYDECLSELSAGKTCPSKAELGYAVSDCGKGENCNALFDFTSTTVRLPNATVEGSDRVPKSSYVTEAICSSRKVESWMVNKYEEDREFWESLGVASPPMFIGSATGMFRIFPGMQSKNCGGYDPRERPWYKGAVPNTISNAAPRHVVFLLDKSLSMGEPMSPTSTQTKLDYMKYVVTSILNFLTDNDSVAVITYAEQARVRGIGADINPPYHWRPANSTNIEKLVYEVNALQPSGRSNWMEGFDAAFTLIDNSLQRIADDSTDECKVENVAFLFFSDGDMNLPAGITDAEVAAYVNTRVESAEDLSEDGYFQIHTFYYTLGNTDPQQAAKLISCSSNGIWIPLTEGMSAQNATTGYETLFSTPMGDEAHKNFTTWSDPYIFAASEEKGYTVSALLYDRGIEPPRFIGAVGTDLPISAAQVLYEGTEEETEKAIKRITSYITEANFAMTCEQQFINLTYCELQSLRHFSGGNASICIPTHLQTVEGKLDFDLLASIYQGMLAPEDVNVTYVNGTVETTIVEETTAVNDTNVTYVTTAEATPQSDTSQSDTIISTQTLFEALNCKKAFALPCPGKDEYPTFLWNNVNNKGKSFEDRTCCLVGTSTTSDQCPKADEEEVLGLSDKEIFTFIFVPLMVIELLGCYFCICRKKKNHDDDER